MSSGSFHRPHPCPPPPQLDVNIKYSSDNTLERNTSLSDIQETWPSSTPLVSVANPTRLLVLSCLSMQPCQVWSFSPLEWDRLHLQDCFSLFSTTSLWNTNYKWTNCWGKMVLCIYHKWQNHSKLLTLPFSFTVALILFFFFFVLFCTSHTS